MVFNYEHCGGAHPDTRDEIEACDEDPEGEPAATQPPPALPGFCNPYCKAELRGWYCHDCADNPHVWGTLDEYGDLVHDGDVATASVMDRL